MKKNLVIFYLSLVALLIPLNNYAYEDSGAEELKIYMGEIKIISTSNPTRIAIGNPEVADVTSVSNQEITIAPKSPGITTFIVWDIFGEQDYKIRVLPENMQEVKRRIDNLLASLNLPGVYTRAADEENKIIILGSVKTAQERERISTLLGPLKDKTVDMIRVEEEEVSVKIDVQVLELNEGASKNLGLQWPTGVAVATDAKADGSTWVLDPEAAGTRAKFANFFKILQWSRTNFYWKLNLQLQEGNARVLSRPSLICQSGKEAELMVGGEKPVLTTTVSGISGATGTEVEYKEYGIKLKIRPVVTKDGRIKISLSVEISEFLDEEVTLGATAAPTAKAYPLIKRNVSTEMFLYDGQVMAIGGLIRTKREEDVQKVPWLGDIPILGAIFRSRSTKEGGGAAERTDSELYITLVPRIIRSTSSKEYDTEESLPLAKEEKQDTAAVALGITFDSDLPPDIANYTNIVQQRVLENIIYPPQAKAAGFQGTVKLALALSYQGQVLGVTIKESSGYSVLDENAVSMAYQVSPYPPFPPSVESDELEIHIPVVYKLY